LGKEGFKSLEVWPEAKRLAVEIYQLTEHGKFLKDYGLRDQIRRAAVSVASNIAEGDERNTDKEAVHFFYIAKGSIAEIRTQLQIAQEIGYLDNVRYEKLDEEYKILGKRIGRLIVTRMN